MVHVNANLVMELRKRTGSGMMECKQALIKANANIEVAIENMRKSGVLTAEKKSASIAVEGLVLVKKSDSLSVILEVNCQTDFVAKDKKFIAFSNKVLEAALISQPSIEKLKTQFEGERISLVAQFGENINIRRVKYVKGKVLASYCHTNRIGVVISGEGNSEILRNIAMHIAASRPEFLYPTDVPVSLFEKEKAIQFEIAMNENKSSEIVERIVLGRMKKFVNEISLTSQNFVMEPKKTVGEILKENLTSVSKFIRLELAEGIEKTQKISFAEEVAQVQRN
ncbi:elongation factor Ts [Candidatus Photodesmus katoptron]|uniref:Elongation factor Ts n=1 Tax=Candidatus Photodesmus katoptron Akat1 TaxID=1236703 RepID=S3DL99_9GAMM|nr:translation elongation factor Ts [Candidatus Photodesmus katoptron]EPE37929.1 translation elongation factor Ts [Candidatus Photodesmus katoptron Akat1]KEY90351.1 elongation factor Ts [Candidatus Photodesmus katoptron]